MTPPGNKSHRQKRGGGKETSSAKEAVAGSTRADDMEFLSPPCLAGWVAGCGGGLGSAGLATPQDTPPPQEAHRHRTPHHHTQKIMCATATKIMRYLVTHYGTPFAEPVPCE